MGLWSKLKETHAPAIADAEEHATPPDNQYRGAGVGWSKDLKRILELPQINTEADGPALAKKWTAALSRANKACRCATEFGRCITELNDVQGRGLESGYLYGGLLGPIGVGHGKTGLTILLPMVMKSERAVLLLPSNLKPQFVERDFPQWSAHFNVPNLAGGPTFTPGKPILRVLSYAELSNMKASELLAQIEPDLIIADEAHNLSAKDAARTKRFLRYLGERKNRQGKPARFVCLSGTLTKRSLMDYAHLSEHALGERSPLPLHYPTLVEWAAALDAGSFMKPAGNLRRLCSDESEPVRSGFRRRLVSSPGVVATKETALGTSLLLTKFQVQAPTKVRNLTQTITEAWERPDGEPLTDVLSLLRCARQMSAGFFYRWIWPHNEPTHIIKEWLAARKEWFTEVREKAGQGRVQLDSPGLVERAAARWHFGYSHDNPDGSTTHVPKHTKKGPKPVWDSATYLRWNAIRDQAHPETQTVWEDRFLVEACAEWGQKNKGLIWVEFGDFGREIAKTGALPYFGGGEEASSGIIKEKGKRSVVAAIKAHGTGKNLQAFHQNLVPTSPTSGAIWEQMIARTHRPHQLASEVTCEVAQHLPVLEESFSKAMSASRYIQETTGSKQKLLMAKVAFTTHATSFGRDAALLDDEEEV